MSAQNCYVPTTRDNNPMPDFGSMAPVTKDPSAPVAPTPIDRATVANQQNSNFYTGVPNLSIPPAPATDDLPEVKQGR